MALKPTLGRLRAPFARPRLGRRFAATAALLIAAAIVLVLVLRGESSPPAPTPGLATSGAGVTTVQRRDLVATDTESGTLGYANAGTVYNRLSGTITWLPDVGQLIRPGQVLFRVGDEPVILMNGSTPAYRDLGPDDEPGRDIAQLNRNLIKLGFDAEGIVDDDEWQAATSDGVELLQESLGLPETGTLTLGQVVFLPGPQLVSTVDATVGGTGGGSGSSGSGGSGSGSGGTSADAADPPGSQLASLHLGPETGTSSTAMPSVSSTATSTTSTRTTTSTTPTTPRHRRKRTTPTKGTHPTTITTPTTGTHPTPTPSATESPGGSPSHGTTGSAAGPSPAAGDDSNGGDDRRLGSAIDRLSSELGRLQRELRAERSADDKSSSKAGLGSGGFGGGSATAILQTSSTRLLVTVDLPAGSQSEAVIGSTVAVEMPAGNTVKGTVISVSRVAVSSSSDSSASPAGSGASSSTVPVTIRLKNRHAGAGLDQAAVSVDFVQSRARNVLSVPVTALVATSGQSYALQEAAAPHRLVPVRTGLFGAGYVQVSGPGVVPGLRVTDSEG